MLVMACAALLALGSPTASAHEGEGIFELQAQEPADAATVSYAVRLTWANDGHPAFDATVTATPIDPSGTPATPVPMQFEGDDGRYSGTITYPSSGTWTVRFTSVSPSSTMEIVEEVAAPAPSATTSSTPSTTTTTAPADVDDVQPERAAPVTDDDGGGGMVGLLLAASLAIVAVGAVVALRTRRSRASDA
ncbi:MAG TPA: hypothetical protein DCS55_12150 [Acidimicrobiaceae bacterium]|nr:hypothetical protein [Acidimicrobiaceae bacterium]